MGGYSTAHRCDFKHFVSVGADDEDGAGRIVTAGRAYLDHNDMGVTSDDTAEDRIERLSNFCRMLACAAVVDRAAT